MKRPKVIHGVVIAGALGLLVIPVYMLFAMLAYGSTLTKLVLGFLALTYILWILRRHPEKKGRMVLGLLSFIALGGAVLFGLSMVLFVPYTVAVVWGVRSLVAYSSIISAVLDGMLCITCLIAGLWAMLLTGSMTVAVWCFLLGQSLFVFIPERFRARLKKKVSTAAKSKKVDKATDRFSRAHCAAEQALRELCS